MIFLKKVSIITEIQTTDQFPLWTTSDCYFSKILEQNLLEQNTLLSPWWVMEFLRKTPYRSYLSFWQKNWRLKSSNFKMFELLWIIVFTSILLKTKCFYNFKCISSAIRLFTDQVSCREKWTFRIHYHLQAKSNCQWGNFSRLSCKIQFSQILP